MWRLHDAQTNRQCVKYFSHRHPVVHSHHRHPQVCFCGFSGKGEGKGESCCEEGRQAGWGTPSPSTCNIPTHHVIGTHFVSAAHFQNIFLEKSAKIVKLFFGIVLIIFVKWLLNHIKSHKRALLLVVVRWRRGSPIDGCIPHLQPQTTSLRRLTVTARRTVRCGHGLSECLGGWI